MHDDLAVFVLPYISFPTATVCLHLEPCARCHKMALFVQRNMSCLHAIGEHNLTSEVSAWLRECHPFTHVEQLDP